jgi:prepilin signal peptidase PulO-like enzyme (type II secretory pathway)
MFDLLLVTITVMIIAIIAVLGVILGSFVNALVWRLHEQSELIGKKGEETEQRRHDLSISKGRSMCPHCEHTLAAKDLVPVLSWVWLRGKCRYCKAPISWQYPLVELLTGVLFLGSYLAWPLAFQGVWLMQFVIWLVCLVGFVALAVYDLHWFELPDKIVFPLIALASADVLVSAVWERSFTVLWQSAVAAVLIFGLFWVLYQASRGAWIGGGDVKLAIVLGLLVGTPLRACLVIFFASLIGTIVSLPTLAKGKKGLTAHIPFGPYLLLATVIVVVYGASIISWYQNMLWA